jgi:transcriptional regulator with PAS, ATPase and Fis domain
LFATVLTINLLHLNVNFNNPGSTLGVCFIFLLMAQIIAMIKTQDQAIIKYVNELDTKFKEEKNWKKLCEELQEGIILIDKDHNIFYNNKAISSIFSFNSNKTLSKNRKNIEIKVKTIKIDVD